MLKGGSSSTVFAAISIPLCKHPLRVDLHCRVIFTCVRAAMYEFYERSRLSLKVEPRSTSRLTSTLYILPQYYLRD